MKDRSRTSIIIVTAFLMGCGWVAYRCTMPPPKGCLGFQRQ